MSIESMFSRTAEDLRECSMGIEELVRLMREDQLRRDADEEPLLKVAGHDALLAAVSQLSSRAYKLTDDLAELHKVDRK
ncbi:hypothetical protein [Billgrantia desiderata]|uniref:hypothetical protein n=1 Tax=Billgrantia desiderata TaxID=52021 RepID=UPI003F3BD245